MLTTTGRTSFQRGMRTPRSHGGVAVGASDSSRRKSSRRAKYAASAKTTRSRMASTGCTPKRFTLTPLVPGPVPSTSSSAARPSARPSGAITARRSGDASKSTSDAARSRTRPPAIPLANADAVSVSRSGSRSAIMLIRPMPDSISRTGSTSGSSCAPRQRRSRCAIAKAAKNQYAARLIASAKSARLRTTSPGFSEAMSAGVRIATRVAAGRRSSRARSWRKRGLARTSAAGSVTSARPPT